MLAGWSPGVHLSEAGRAQAAALAARLREVPVAAAYSSPLERCRETASLLAQGRGLRVRLTRGLGEVGYGEWTGRPLKELARTRMWRVVQARPSMVRFPGGESMLEVRDRVVSVVERIRSRHEEENVVCVTHADIIKVVAAEYAGAHLDLYQRFVVAPCSVSVVAFGPWGAVLERLNDTGTLDDLRGRPRGRGGRPLTQTRA